MANSTGNSSKLAWSGRSLIPVAARAGIAVIVAALVTAQHLHLAVLVVIAVAEVALVLAYLVLRAGSFAAG